MLGICVGMQLMMTESHENGFHKGLNIINGDVVKFDIPNRNDNFKILQI